MCEGPRVVEAALEHGAELVECVVAAEATAVAHAVAERAAKAGVPVRALAPGVAGRVADTVNTQGLFGVARLARMKVEGIARATLIIETWPLTESDAPNTQASRCDPTITHSSGATAPGILPTTSITRRCA